MGMDGLLTNLLVVANPFKSLSLDDTYSRYNRLYLFAMCLVSGAVVTVNDYAGETIECHGFDIFEHDFSENYCWVQGIYTIKEAYDIPLGGNVPYPGIIPEETPCFDFTYADGTTYECPDEESILPMTRVYHLWYQWIPFYFWICAGVFYLPYLIFHHSDIGNLKPLIKLLGNSVDSEEDERTKIDKASSWVANRLVCYMKASGPLQYVLVRHKFFFIVLFTKIANLFVVVIVLCFTEQIFGIGSFMSYGFDWITYNYYGGSEDESTDSPVDKLFPKMVACEVEKWGTTGIVNEAGMCVLAPNVVNSYFFLAYWFVLMTGLAFNCFSVIFTTTSHLFTLGRWKSLLSATFMKGTSQGKWVYFNSGTSGQITLDIIAHNIPPRTFEKFFNKVADKVAREPSKKNIYSNANTTETA